MMVCWLNKDNGKFFLFSPLLLSLNFNHFFFSSVSSHKNFHSSHVPDEMSYLQVEGFNTTPHFYEEIVVCYIIIFFSCIRCRALDIFPRHFMLFDFCSRSHCHLSCLHTRKTVSIVQTVISVILLLFFVRRMCWYLVVG